MTARDNLCCFSWSIVSSIMLSSFFYTDPSGNLSHFTDVCCIANSFLSHRDSICRLMSTGLFRSQTKLSCFEDIIEVHTILHWSLIFELLSFQFPLICAVSFRFCGKYSLQEFAPKSPCSTLAPHTSQYLWAITKLSREAMKQQINTLTVANLTFQQSQATQGTCSALRPRRTIGKKDK